MHNLPINEPHFVRDLSSQTSDSPKNLKIRLQEMFGNNKKKFKVASGIISVFVLAAATIFSSQLVTRQKSFEQSKAANAGGKALKIFEISYTPTNSPNVGYLNQITSVAKNLISTASAYQGRGTNAIHIENVHAGFKRNTARPNPDPSNIDAFKASYAAILNDNSGNLAGDGKTPCDIINTQNVDQVWLWVDPTVDPAPGREYWTVSPTSNYGSSQSFCGTNKSFVIMGLDYSQQASLALHSFTHFLEFFLAKLQGDELFTERYAGIIQIDTKDSGPIAGQKLEERCGNPHVPPTTPLTGGIYIGYSYDSPLSISSSCRNWNPDNTGPKETLNSNTWKALWKEEYRIPGMNSSSILESSTGYYLWWTQNFPNLSSATYKGKLIPTWWDFVVDMDNTIRTYMASGYWMNPNIISPSSTNSTSGTSGTITTFTHSERGAVLGTSTDGSVLADTTGYAPMVIVTAAYRAKKNPSAQINSLTYCGRQMYRVIGGENGRAKFQDQTSEMWYLNSPPTGVCEVKALFSADPEDRILSATTIQNVKTSDFMQSVNKAGYATGSPFFELIKDGPRDTKFICTYSNYPNGGANIVTPQLNRWQQVWSSGYINNIVNIQSGLGISDARTLEGEVINMRWNATQSFPWAGICINLRVAPSTSGTPPPVAPIPSVDLKGNNQNGPLTILSGDYINLTWTSAYISACNAIGPWTGSKGIVGGPERVGPITSDRIYSISCTGPNSAQASDSVVVKVLKQPTVDLKVNISSQAVNGPVTITVGAGAQLSWSSTNATSCTASGSWTGTKATTGTQTYTGADLPIGTRTYTIKCVNGNLSATDSVTINVVPPPSVDVKINGSDSNVILSAPGTVNLTWNTTNVTGCIASGNWPDWTGTKPASGSTSFSITNGNANYFTLTCTSGGRNFADTVAVLPPPFTLSITTPSVFPTTFTRYQSISLLYNVRDIDGTPATSTEGFGMQAYIFKSTGATVSGVNGTYLSSHNLWQVNLKLPGTAGTYKYTISAYCSVDSSTCATKYGRARSVKQEFTITVK